MIKEDYFLKQIDQLGQVLGAMMFKLLLIKEHSKGTFEISDINHFFESELDFNLDSVLARQSEELLLMLEKKKRFNENNLELMADILSSIAEINIDQGIELYKKSLAIYK